MSRIYKRYPSEVKTRAIALRQEGYSLYELRDLLKVRLATVQGWVKNVPLSVEAKEQIQKRIVDGGKAGRSQAVIVNRLKIEAWKQKIRVHSRERVKALKFTPALGRAMCSILYICEGAKYPSARQLGFGNSDPRMIRFFLQLLRNCFAVDERKFRCQICYRHDQSQKSLIQYWSQITRIPRGQFYLKQPDARTEGKPTLRKDYRGVCVVQYLNTTLQFTLQAIGEALMEINGAGGSRTLTSAMPLRRPPARLRPQD